MSQGRLSQLPCLQVLLIALAIQGITPDAQDLASVNAVRIFCPILTELDTASQQDEWPDDVCVPVRSGARLAFPQLRIRDKLPTFEPAMTEARFQPIDLASSRFAAHQGRCASIIDLTCSLCRLIC